MGSESALGALQAQQGAHVDLYYLFFSQIKSRSLGGYFWEGIEEPRVWRKCAVINLSLLQRA